MGVANFDPYPNKQNTIGISQKKKSWIAMEYQLCIVFFRMGRSRTLLFQKQLEYADALCYTVLRFITNMYIYIYMGGTIYIYIIENRESTYFHTSHHPSCSWQTYPSPGTEIGPCGGTCFEQRSYRAMPCRWMWSELRLGTIRFRASSLVHWYMDVHPCIYMNLQDLTGMNP